MEQIVLEKIEKQGRRITYGFSLSRGLKPFFSEIPLWVEYPESVETVPDAVAAIPFVSSVIPLIWLTDGCLELEALDQDFHDCLPLVREGYRAMFPESEFRGQIRARRLEQWGRPDAKASGVLFSGGLDAVSTLITHLEEKPHLIYVWGADIRYENVEGWELLNKGNQFYADRFGLPLVNVRSTFREFDREEELDRVFKEQLKNGWWHGMKHAIALLGHAAPYAWLHGIGSLYIASSHTVENEPVRCASNPRTDNFVRFAGTRVYHDGYEFDRQRKVLNVVEYCRRAGQPLPLHVCWISQSGGNCCRCEKCYRTMAGLMAEGEDPRGYGFPQAEETLEGLRWTVVRGSRTEDMVAHGWVSVQRRVAENQKTLRRLPFWHWIGWLRKVDFTRPDTVQMPLSYRLRGYLGQFAFYDRLHRWKAHFLEKDRT